MDESDRPSGEPKPKDDEFAIETSTREKVIQPSKDIEEEFSGKTAHNKLINTFSNETNEDPLNNNYVNTQTAEAAITTSIPNNQPNENGSLNKSKSSNRSTIMIALPLIIIGFVIIYIAFK